MNLIGCLVNFENMTTLTSSQQTLLRQVGLYDLFWKLYTGSYLASDRFGLTWISLPDIFLLSAKRSLYSRWLEFSYAS